MKIAYLLWGYPYDDEIIRAFESEGIIISRIDFSQNMKLEYNINNILEKKLTMCNADIVFSVNFYSHISDYCQYKGIPYCSWILQLPNFDLYTKSVFNLCNYIGICDSYLVEKMWNLQIEKVFFLPDAIELGEKIKDVNVEREFCYIAKHPTSILNTDKMTIYGKGYLDSFIHAQRVLFGVNILEDGMINRVYQEFINCNPVPEQILPQMQKKYVADKYLAPVCTEIQQNIFMKNNENIMTIYSDYEYELCNCKKYPYVSNELERRKIYANKEFSLVLAPHVLSNGIPRDTLEVIAAGGFPICGYQKDYSYFFKLDENLACFKTSSEFKECIINYGNNPDKRELVKENAYNIVAKNHTYKNRIVNMLEMWSKL